MGNGDFAVGGGEGGVGEQWRCRAESNYLVLDSIWVAYVIIACGGGGRMQLESQRVGPVSLSERILFIDVLRGMALFGILAANMRAFFAPLDCYGYIGVLYHSRADVLA